jgi:rhodanese-related sulfurtransferase
MARTVDELLEAARARIERVEASDAAEAVERGDAVLLDIRSDSQRAADGVVPGAVFHPRNVVEWRADPRSEHRDPAISDPRGRVIVMCDEGYQSSLVAATLRDLGLPETADLVGGFQAWRAAGLPVDAR